MLAPLTTSLHSVANKSYFFTSGIRMNQGSQPMKSVSKGMEQEGRFTELHLVVKARNKGIEIESATRFLLKYCSLPHEHPAATREGIEREQIKHFMRVSYCPKQLPCRYTLVVACWMKPVLPSLIRCTIGLKRSVTVWDC